jgi:hypothetical protein
MNETSQLSQENKAQNLRMAYQEVCTSFHAIDDFRAKMLGLLPPICLCS